MEQTTPSVYDDPRLQTARGNYETAERQATTTEASAVSLPTMLRDALTKKFSADNPLVQGRERALENYIRVGDQAPLDVTPRSAGGNADVIYTPGQQSALIGAKRASALAPLSTANYLLGLAEGGITDIVDSASRASLAEATRQRGNATLARQSYVDILDELSKRADEAYREKELALKGKESGGLDIASLLALMGGGDTLGAFDDLSGLAAFEEEEPKEQKKKEVKVDLKSTTKAAAVPGAQTLPQGGGGEWALSPLASWFGNLFRGPEPLNVKSSSQLGF